MDEITVEELEKQIRRAAHCASVTLPANQLRALLDLAMRAPDKYKSFTIDLVEKRMREVKVELPHDEIRRILELALQAKLVEKKQRPKLKLVASSDKKR